MIPHPFQWTGKIFENACPLMRDEARLSMPNGRRAHYLPAACRNNALMPETHAQNRRRLPALENDLATHTKIMRVGGVARSGRNNNMRIGPLFHVAQRNGIVPRHDGIASQRPHRLVEVIGERVVIVDNKCPHHSDCPSSEGIAASQTPPPPLQHGPPPPTPPRRPAKAWPAPPRGGGGEAECVPTLVGTTRVCERQS